MSFPSGYTCSNCCKNDKFHYFFCEHKSSHVCCYSCYNDLFEHWTGTRGNGVSCAICCKEAFVNAAHKIVGVPTGLQPWQAGTADDPVLLDAVTHAVAGKTHAVAGKTPGFKHGQPVALKKDFILRAFPDGNPEGCSKDAFTSTARKGATVYIWQDYEPDSPEVCIALIHNGDNVLTHYGPTRPDLGMIAADMVYAVPGEYETFEITRVKTQTRSNNGMYRRNDDSDGEDQGCSSMAAARHFG